MLPLPLAPLCRPDCPGLCSVCGARLADDPDHQHVEVDPRWAALAALQAGETPPDARTIDDRTGTTDRTSGTGTTGSGTQTSTTRTEES